jgi:DNA polymerase III delta subunit
MLYVFFGTDTIAVRQKAHAFARDGAEDAEVVSITSQDFSPGAIEEAAGNSPLFGGERRYIIDTPSANAAMFEYVFDNLDLLAGSRNTFVLIEGKLLAAEKKKVQKHAAEATELLLSAVAKGNPFALGDAFARRDKKSLWLLLQEARANGSAAEQTIGMLFSQLRAMRLAARTTSADEAGQNPFVYRKAKGALAKFKDGEVDALSRDLLALYHDGHLGRRDIDLALEKWVLEL